MIVDVVIVLITISLAGIAAEIANIFTGALDAHYTSLHRSESDQ